MKRAIKASAKESNLDSDTGSSFGGSDASDASSALSTDDDSDDPLILSPSKAKGKSKAKSKAKPRGSKKFAGKGRKLGDDSAQPSEVSDGEGDDSGMAEEDLDALDDETREMTLQKMKEARSNKRADEREKMKPIRKAEAALKKELGRKLTNGEKNSIRLVLVS